MQQSPQVESGEGIMEVLLIFNKSLLSTMRMRNKAVGLLDSKNPRIFSALSFQLLIHPRQSLDAPQRQHTLPITCVLTPP